MHTTRPLVQLMAATAVVLGTVFLMVGPGSDMLNRPLAIAGMALIGLGLIKKSKQPKQPVEA